MRLDVHPHLALVVHRALAHTRCRPVPSGSNGGDDPLLQRLRRLHIVVPVAQHGRCRTPFHQRCGIHPLRIHQRVPARPRPASEVSISRTILHPDPASAHRRTELRSPANIRHACSGAVEIDGIRKQFLELLHEAFLVRPAANSTANAATALVAASDATLRSPSIAIDPDLLASIPYQRSAYLAGQRSPRSMKHWFAWWKHTQNTSSPPELRISALPRSHGASLEYMKDQTVASSSPTGQHLEHRRLRQQMAASWPTLATACRRPPRSPARTNSILDLGCGDGALTAQTRRQRSHRMTGIDASARHGRRGPRAAASTSTTPAPPRPPVYRKPLRRRLLERCAPLDPRRQRPVLASLQASFTLPSNQAGALSPRWAGPANIAGYPNRPPAPCS